MSGVRAWAIQQAAIDAYPDRYQTLIDTMKAAIEDPSYVDLIEKSGTPREFIEYSTPEQCAKSAQETLDLTEKFKDQLSGRR